MSTFTVLHAFTNSVDGGAPIGSLLEDLQGNLYGTTSQGGANGAGVVYKADRTGAITILHAFAGADGSNPGGGLLNLIGNLNAGGNLYGSTVSGGTSGAGTVYQLDQTGASFATLHSFSGGADGGSPQGRLTRFTDGNLYGTTSSGASGYGTIFKLAPNGTLTTLHAFTGGADGGSPQAGLSPSISYGFFINGNLFGTTSTGGAFGGGTVFSISPSGTFTTLYSLAPNTDGAASLAELVPDLNGNLYGTASQGGSGAAGTIFKITTGGKFTLLFSYPTDPVTSLNPKGANPGARLAFYLNGNIYGTTTFGGDTGAGVAFKIVNGTYTVLHAFQGTDGQQPQGQLLPSIDGNVYGTAAGGGAASHGVLFALPQ